MELSLQAKSNLKQLGFELHNHPDQYLSNLVPQFGYTSYGFGTTYDDETEGVLVGMDENHNKYNDGIYMLHKLNDGNLVMEVIVPNSKDRGNLIQQKSDEIANFVDGLDLDDLEIYDQAEMWGFILADAVVKPLANTIYPNAKVDAKDQLKRQRFINLFMPRFLANVAHLYAGDDQMREEAVNSEPYVLKMMLDQGTDKTEPNIAHPKSSDNPAEDDQAVDDK